MRAPRRGLPRRDRARCRRPASEGPASRRSRRGTRRGPRAAVDGCRRGCPLSPLMTSSALTACRMASSLDAMTTRMPASCAASDELVEARARGDAHLDGRDDLPSRSSDEHERARRASCRAVLFERRRSRPSRRAAMDRDRSRARTCATSGRSGSKSIARSCAALPASTSLAACTAPSANARADDQIVAQHDAVDSIEPPERFRIEHQRVAPGEDAADLRAEDVSRRARAGRGRLPYSAAMRALEAARRREAHREPRERDDPGAVRVLLDGTARELRRVAVRLSGDADHAVADDRPSVAVRASPKRRGAPPLRGAAASLWIASTNDVSGRCASAVKTAVPRSRKSSVRSVPMRVFERRTAAVHALDERERRAAPLAGEGNGRNRRESTGRDR